MIRPLLAAAALSLLATPAFAQQGRTFASSYKKDSRAGDNAFNYNSAMDSDLKTSWQTDPEKDVTTQWIELDVPTSTVDKLAVVVGWDKNENAFKDYGRLKAAKIEIFDKEGMDRKQLASVDVTFEDKRGYQMIDLPDTKIGDFGGIVRLNVKEMYKGVDYPSLAVGELRVHLLEFPAETVGLNNAPPALDEMKNDASMAFDDNDRTYFVAKDTTTSIVMEASGYGVSTVGITPGPKTHARPKTVKIKSLVLDQEATHVIPEDAKGQQWLPIPIVKGYTGGAWGEIQVEVVDVWPGSVAENPLAIGELRMNATTIEEF